MAAVNMNNLIPIGPACNNRPAKGFKNILLNGQKTRIKAYYPFRHHSSFSVNFGFIRDPSIDGVKDHDWALEVKPVDKSETDIFDSWQDTFNISPRYKSYFNTEIFIMWESDYKSFIDESDDLEHADSIDDFKQNISRWKSSFQIKRRPGSLLYRSFIDYLINQASEAYLFSLYMNFKDQTQAA